MYIWLYFLCLPEISICIPTPSQPHSFILLSPCMSFLVFWNLLSLSLTSDILFASNFRWCVSYTHPKATSCFLILLLPQVCCLGLVFTFQLVRVHDSMFLLSLAPHHKEPYTWYKTIDTKNKYVKIATQGNVIKNHMICIIYCQKVMT